MGVVYKAQDPHIGRIVALKTMLLPYSSGPQDVELLSRLKQEAQAAGRLSHPNIVVIYEYGEDGETAYIAMAYVEGRELKSYLDSGEEFSLAAICNISGQILSALQYSHVHDITHRDIKPSNIMIMPNGHVMVTDFGIARLESSELTQVGTAIGTPSYMSPEQCMGQRVDGRSDIFSAGIILYQLLTGEKPFAGSSVASILHKIVQVDPVPPSELNVKIPKAFDEIIKRCLAKSPADRYSTAEEFSFVLQQVSDQEGLGGSDNWDPAYYAGKVAQQPDSEKLDKSVVFSEESGEEVTVALSLPQEDEVEVIDEHTIMLADVENINDDLVSSSLAGAAVPSVAGTVEDDSMAAEIERKGLSLSKVLLFFVPVLLLLVGAVTVKKMMDGPGTMPPVANQDVGTEDPKTGLLVNGEEHKNQSEHDRQDASTPQQQVPAMIAEEEQEEQKETEVTKEPVADEPKATLADQPEDTGTVKDVVKESIVLNSVPEGVAVKIEALGMAEVTPTVLHPGPGLHQVYLTKSGFHDMSIVVSIRSQEQLTLTVPMDPL